MIEHCFVFFSKIHYVSLGGVLTIGIQIAKYFKYDMNHISLIRLVDLKRPGFQSQQHVVPNFG